MDVNLAFDFAFVVDRHGADLIRDAFVGDCGCAVHDDVAVGGVLLCNRDGDSRVMSNVADFDGSGLREDFDDFAVPAEPDRRNVRGPVPGSR